MRPLRLLRRKVLVRRATQADVTRGGLLLPTVARELPNQGTVVAIGSMVRELLVNDDVIFPKYHDRKVVIDDEELLFFEEDELHARVRGLPRGLE